MRDANRRGLILILLLGMTATALLPSIASSSPRRPIAYRFLSEVLSGDAASSIARTVAAAEIAATPAVRAFEELGNGVAWLPRAQGGSCADVAVRVPLSDRQAGEIAVEVQARCVAPLELDRAPCARYRIEIQGGARAAPEAGDGAGEAVLPEWQEVRIRGEGEMLSCAGEPAARAASLGIERMAVLQPWASAPGAAADAQSIEIAWAALP